MTKDLILALDLGGTKLAAGLFNRDGDLLDRQISLLEGRSGKDVGLLIQNIISQFITVSIQAGQRIRSIGIAVPGIYHRDNGVVWAPNIKGWEAYPLMKDLAQLKSLHAVNIFIDSDRACYILGESWKGASKGCKHAIYLAVGTGIGAGILVNGVVLRGSADIAGAIGWMTVREEYLAPYKRYGCLEYHASGQGIALSCREATKISHHRLWGVNGDYNNLKTEDIFNAMHAGDQVAISIIDNAIVCWGQAAANLVSLFNPEMIVFGGGVFGPATLFLDRIYQEACRWAQPISIMQVQFVPSLLGENVALYGAAFLARD